MAIILYEESSSQRLGYGWVGCNESEDWGRGHSSGWHVASALFPSNTSSHSRVYVYAFTFYGRVRRDGSPSGQTVGLPAQDLRYARGCLLYVLREKSHFLCCQQPAPEVVEGGKLHFLFVFTVNIQEDAEEHQEAAPDVPDG
ncbi:hypothetical protein EYF80_005120 [Liparis tanakae]|uniref:Uncharacterized protein n=1 Tax=Liparis tanakae TaxID=230148 RepID=A0A4Z2J2Y3_9TELE|nr:hypothetical protein EYF80_005120 [Liparis tanakae]